MTDKKIIIIGAGIAGLSTGVHARMNGYEAQIFEHHAHPGGVAAAWKRKGYLFDGGIHFLMGCRPGTVTHDLYKLLGVIPHTPLKELELYARYVDEESGRFVDVTRDGDRLRETILALAPDQRSRLEGFFKALEKFNSVDTFRSMADAPGLKGLGSSIREFWGMRRLLPYFLGPYGRSMKEYAAGIRDPWPRFILEYLFMPEVPVWFSLLILSQLFQGKLAVFLRGSKDFARAIETRYRSLGGEVLYRATVKKILVEHDRAVGVRLADGSEQRGDWVVSAADGHSTIFEMLGGRYADRKIRHRYRTWELIRPIVILSFGVARTFPGAAWLNIIRLRRPLVVGERSNEHLMLRIFNYSEHFAPEGGTSLVVILETEWGFWEKLVGDTERYREEKRALADAVMERLEEHYPGIAGTVEVSDVATPTTLYRYTRNYRGAYEGFLPASDVVTKTVPRSLPGLRNFFMAGQWVMPGGGVPPSLFSGRHAVQLICRAEKRPFLPE